MSANPNGQFLKNNDVPSVDYSDLQSFKEFAERRNIQLQKMLGDTPSDVKQSEDQYTNREGMKMRVKVYQPTEPSSTGSPLIVMYHGGGFCIGAPEGEEQTCRNMVQAFGAVCVSASYRLAPEHPFPAAPNDSWDALKWAAANAKSLKADPSQGFIVGGTSAGGNITAVLALLARDEGLSPPLTGQYLAIPAVGNKKWIPEKYKDRFLSFEQNKDVPVLPIAAIDMFMKGYAPDEDDHVHYTVIAHPKGHKGLPPAYFQIDGMDPLRDEGLIYATMLDEDNGIKTKVDVYPGQPHGHWGFFPFLKASAQFRKEQINGFGWLLDKEPAVHRVANQVNPTSV
ncbi:hypothetical protein LTR24_010701 [Lithohypha guttulata]|uniref:Alpha/beta hydrolase fold-3 domain-containing protein n=1 Tax=Lithohypha guttulata TaxID=1690604 RepID=A0ABR0JT05_9EURO|nr:hypothetical protein LTR24_010701 [Lithohypha guttulata]